MTLTRLRPRATALVYRADGGCLLVLDRGKHHYSLPGGGMDRNEPALAAAAREVYEETRLEPVGAELLFEHRGAVNLHHVVRVFVRGDRVLLQRHELDGYRWWSGREKLPLNAHVRDILAKARWPGLA